MNTDKASGLLTTMIDVAIQMRYLDINDPKELWDTVKTDFEKVIKLDG